MRAWAQPSHTGQLPRIGHRQTAASIAAKLTIVAFSFCVTMPARAQCELQHVLPSSGTPGAVFGWSICATAEFAVIGAPYGTVSQFGDGAAFLFHRTGQQWVQTGMLSASNGAFGDYFGAAMATDGQHLLISAPAAQRGSSLGSVYVFGHQGNNIWTQQAMIDPLPTETLDHFGTSLALQDSTAIIGAFRNDHGKVFGKAFAYRFNGETWQREAALVPANHPQALVGWSVAIQNDRALVGALSTTSDPANEGAAYVFERSPKGGWTHAGTLAPQIMNASMGFGCAVALSGGGGDSAGEGAGCAAVVGAYLDSDPAHDSGSVFVFQEQESGAWSERQRLVAPDGASHDYFGFSLALRDDRLLIGAYQHDSKDGAMADTGQAYIFHGGPDGTWRPAGALTGGHVGPSDQFGWAVALAGDVAIIGATGADDHAQDSGSAFAFAVGGGDCNGNGQLDTCDIAAGTIADDDNDGIPDECAPPCAADIAPIGAVDGTVDIDDLLVVLNNFGETRPSIADLSGDGVVDINDLLIIVNSWGPCP